MSKLEVDAIEPQSGTTLTIGASGDTVNIASGATITDFTSTGIDDNATSTAITIDSSQNVGIGTTLGTATLNVLADSGSQGIDVLGRSSDNRSRIQLISNDSSTVYSQWDYSGTTVELKAIANVPLVFQTNGTERMRIDSSGNVGIGTSSPAELLNLSASSPVMRFTDSDDNNYHHIFSDSDDFYISADRNNTGSGNLIFRNGGTSERMRIDSSGKVLVNRTSTAESTAMDIKHASGTAFTYGLVLDANPASGTQYHIQFQRNSATRGTITSSISAVQYNTTSDYRLKENVSYDFDATTRLKQLKPARFNFIADADTTVDGFLAHEVSSVVPEAITGEKDAVDENGNPKYQGIDQSKLVPLLVKTIQELEARITALETNQP